MFERSNCYSTLNSILNLDIILMSQDQIYLVFEDEIIKHYCNKLPNWIFKPGQNDNQTREIRVKFSKYFSSCLKLLQFGFCEVAITIYYINKVSEIYPEAFTYPTISSTKLIFATCASIVHKLYDDKVYKEKDLERIFHVAGLGKAEVLFCQKTNFKFLLQVQEVIRLLVDLKTQFLLDLIAPYSKRLKFSNIIKFFSKIHETDMVRDK